MEKFKCDVCGQEHPELPRDVGYGYPADYFKVPQPDRVIRVKYTDDLCSIDDAEFYARGVLALPIRETTEEFRWGVWARITRRDFVRYQKLWTADEAAAEPPFPGHLSGGIAAYSDTDMLEVRVQLLVRKRPRFYVVSESHPLGLDQRQGITLIQAHQFVAPFVSKMSDQSQADPSRF
jgi:hypothetical protein